MASNSVAHQQSTEWDEECARWWYEAEDGGVFYVCLCVASVQRVCNCPLALVSDSLTRWLPHVVTLHHCLLLCVGMCNSNSILLLVAL